MPGVHKLPVVRLPSPCPQNLNLDGIGEVLILGHALRGLPMYHDPTVSKGPCRTAGSLLTQEAILDTEQVVREGRIVKHMSEGLIELIVLVIGDPDDAILNGKGVIVVNSSLMSPNLNRPTG